MNKDSIMLLKVSFISLLQKRSVCSGPFLTYLNKELGKKKKSALTSTKDFSLLAMLNFIIKDLPCKIVAYDNFFFALLVLFGSAALNLKFQSTKEII